MAREEAATDPVGNFLLPGSPMKNVYYHRIVKSVLGVTLLRQLRTCVKPRNYQQPECDYLVDLQMTGLLQRTTSHGRVPDITRKAVRIIDRRKEAHY